MKYIQLATLVAATFLSLPMSISAMGAKIRVNVRINVGVNNCTGGGNVCPISQTLGAFGEKFTANPMVAQVTDLGSIDQETTADLTIPEKIEGHTLFSFTPTEGELAGKTIYLALRLNEKGRPGTRLAGLYTVELFRMIAGQDPMKDWARAAEFVMKGSPEEQGTQEATSNITSLSFTFMPNGNATTVDPKGTKVEFVLGTKQMK